MHETAVAQSIFDTVISETRKQKAKPVRAKISCGMFEAVNEEILAFAFSAIAKGTAAENMEIDIEQKPIMASCHKCEKEFKFNISNPCCSYCGSDNYDILPDQPLVLEQIIFETD